MARGVNKVILIGNVGDDPDARRFPSGDAVTTIRVATSETWLDKASGERRERTEWHRVVLTGRIGEIAAEYVRKGSKVYIEGSIRSNTYKKDGVDVWRTEIRALALELLDSGGENKRQSRTENNPGEQASPDSGSDMFDDDIPF